MIPTAPLFVFVSALAAICWQAANALTCYETDSQGHVTVKTDATWKYCALSPTRIEEDGIVLGNAYGVSDDTDHTEPYDHAFALRTEAYQLLSVCVYERYDFSGFSPKFKNSQPEYLFRCVCNYDMCNTDTTFSRYLSNMRTGAAADYTIKK
ncbi:hypothetical protein AAVH_13969 [Aphelenchoides avenae]|nr:hypothetical protein AAVH_13969 [Aphelenchus avenae]